MLDTFAAIEQAQRGDKDSEQRLVEQNAPLVHSICRRFLNRGADYDDLFQLGSIGLLKAIRRFNPAFGVCFSTYAVPLIIGEIKRFLRDDGLIKFSRSAKSLATQIQKLGEEDDGLTVDELAKRLNVSREDVALALASRTAAMSLDAPATEDGASLMEFCGSAEFESEAQNRLLTEQLLNTLEPRERLLIMLRFFQNQTQTQVAARLNISQVQVSRLERKILSALKQRTEA
ncbi:MAG: sigma-70 family RNA polymerase sigma factor [Clostridia bacterium]|nr:sigma-70 family RNA polymerase sigma factor [Clostridia bacterium]